MLTYTSDIHRASERLRDIGRQAPYVASVALNRTAEAIQKAITDQMPRVFDRPTPYTLRSLRVVRATKERPAARVHVKDFAGKGTPANRYLTPQVYGGGRAQKRFESALTRIGPSRYYLPAGGAQMDAYGNMSRGQIVRLMSYLQAFGENGYRANATDRSRKRVERRKGVTINGVIYFVSRGKGTQHGKWEQHLPAGIWSKTGFQGAVVKPLLLSIDEPRYTKRLPFYETAEEVFGKTIDAEYSKALDHALATAR